MAGELVLIPFEDDFRIEIRGEPFGTPSYFLHSRAGNEWVRSGALGQDSAESLAVPLLEPGEYILEAVVWWGNNRQHSAIQYFFKFTINEEQAQIPRTIPVLLVPDETHGGQRIILLTVGVLGFALCLVIGLRVKRYYIPRYLADRNDRN